MTGTNTHKKTVNLALQGGGAHGAFAWGVLDYLLEDGRIEIEAITASSAGALNAVALADGITEGGRERAREKLRELWSDISSVGRLFAPVQMNPWARMMGAWNMDLSWSYHWFDTIIRFLSPYQFNPFNINPLRESLARTIDFDAVRTCDRLKLFISATNVYDGKVRVFTTPQVDLDVVMASACLPFLFQAVQIGDEYFWDGGYVGNPALFPLFYHAESRDVIIVHINPLDRDEVPTTAADILNRLNEISFNSSLLKELRAVAFVHKLFDQDMLRDEYREKLKYVLVHSVRADEVMEDLSVTSKFNTDWSFLRHLHDQGREVMKGWMEQHYENLGVRSSVDLRREFLDIGASHLV